MNIEEKLSAIKAINEEKDYVEEKLRHLEALRETTCTGITINVESPIKKGSELDAVLDEMRAFNLPHSVVASTRAVIQLYLEQRREELITKAQSLMK